MGVVENQFACKIHVLTFETKNQEVLKERLCLIALMQPFKGYMSFSEQIAFHVLPEANGPGTS